MRFLTLFPFPSHAGVPGRLINTRELRFPSLPRHCRLPALSTSVLGTLWSSRWQGHISVPIRLLPWAPCLVPS